MAASLVAFDLGGVVGGGGGGVLGGPLFTFGEDGTEFRLGLCRSRCSQFFSSSSFLRGETMRDAFRDTLLGHPSRHNCNLPSAVFKSCNALLQGFVCGMRAQRRMRNLVLASLNVPVTACKLLFQLAKVQAELCTYTSPACANRSKAACAGNHSNMT